MKKYLILLIFLLPLSALAGFEKDLYFGLRQDTDVERLQEFLTEQGLYSGPITGNFYSLTLAAVKNFQVAHLISPVSGYFGPLTRGKVNDILALEGVTDKIVDESGTSISPAITPPKNTDDVVAKLTEQIAILLKQIDELQKQVVELQKQNAALLNIQTQLGQIQANTVPPPTPAPAPAPAPIIKKEVKILTPSCSERLQNGIITGTICGTEVHYFENDERKNASITFSVSNDNAAQPVTQTFSTIRSGYDGKPTVFFTFVASDSGAEPYTFCSNTGDPTCTGFRITRIIIATANGASDTKTFVSRFYYPVSQ